MRSQIEEQIWWLVGIPSNTRTTHEGWTLSYKEPGSMVWVFFLPNVLLSSSSSDLETLKRNRLFPCLFEKGGVMNGERSFILKTRKRLCLNGKIRGAWSKHDVKKEVRVEQKEEHTKKTIELKLVLYPLSWLEHQRWATLDYSTSLYHHFFRSGDWLINALLPF